MTKHMIVPQSSLLSSTAVRLPTLTPENKSSTAKPLADWEIAFVGKRELPMMQFKHISPMRVLSNILIELGWYSNDHMVGRLLLSNGLRPADGVRLKVDDEPLTGKLPFETFIRDGGVVNLNWKASAVRAVCAGRILSIHTVIASSKKPLILKVPLARFVAVSDQLRELIRQRDKQS